MVQRRPHAIAIGMAGSAVLLSTLSGCAGSGSMRKLQDESRFSQTLMVELVDRTDQLRGELLELRKQIQAMRGEVEGGGRKDDGHQQGALETLGKRLASAETSVEALANVVRGMEVSVAGLSDQVARLEALPASAPGSRRDGKNPKPAARAAAPTLKAEELFNRAMESFKSGELGQAILDFEEVVAKHPSNALAGVAQFWIGEAYFATREYQQATAEYKKALDMAPKGEKTPEALLKLGLAYRALKRHDRAREVWAQLLQDFPRSDAAQKARAAGRETSTAAKPGSPTER